MSPDSAKSHDKFKANLATRFTAQRSAQIFALCKDQAALEATASSHEVGRVHEGGR